MPFFRADQIPSDWEISYDIWKNLEESGAKSVILPSQSKKRRLKLKLIPKKQHIQTALTEIFLENNIKNREDLKMFCCRGGVKGQKAIYDKVYELLPPLRGNIEYSEKKTIKLIRRIYQSMLPGYRMYKPTMSPIAREDSGDQYVTADEDTPNICFDRVTLYHADDGQLYDTSTDECLGYYRNGEFVKK